METGKAELVAVTERFKESQIVVAGDLMIDHYIWGKVDRISQEAPVVVVDQTAENKRLGGAGNVVRNLVSLGAKVSVCGVVGDDNSGRMLIAMLEELGVDAQGVLIDRNRPTTMKTRVIAHAQQVVRIDHETREPVAKAFQEGIADQLRARLETAQGVIISDYAKGTVCPPLFSCIEDCYERGLLGVGKIPVLVDPKAPNFALYTRATIIKPNRGEAELASGMKIRSRADGIAAGKKLLEKWAAEMVLITLGEMGMVLVSGSAEKFSAVEVATVAREVFDVSGAGDTASAAFLLSLAAKASPAQAAAIANYASGIAVGEVGTAAVPLSKLQETILKHESDV